MDTRDRLIKYKEIMPIHTRIDRQILIDMGFFTAPASTKYHGNYEGGLFDHSLKVTEMLLELTDKLGLMFSIFLSIVFISISYQSFYLLR